MFEKNWLEIVDDLVGQAQKLTYSDYLPNKEAIMFLQGTKYLTGSDYSDEQLNKSIDTLQDEYYNPEPEEEGVSHYDETVAHREWANQDLLNN